MESDYERKSAALEHRSNGKEHCFSLTTQFGTFALSSARPSGGSGQYFLCTVTVLLLLAFILFVTIIGAASPSDSKSRGGSNRRNVVRPQHCFAPQTILVSIDGFRFDYLHRHYEQARDGNSSCIAPTLVQIAQEGAFSNRGMIPVMPSITFPNHWSMVTGLYPENSGILHNIMYDPERKKTFRYGDDDPTWWHGEPIWKTVTRTRQGLDNYTSGAVFWPGSSVPTLEADAFWTYNRSVSYERRVNRVISLLKGTAADMKGKRADFVTLYFEGVDSAGHQAGPHSNLVDLEIAKVDKALKLLLRALGPNYAEKFNVVVVSDHGMAETRPDTAIDLDNIVTTGTLQDIVTSPFGMYVNVGVSARHVFEIIRRGLKRYAPYAKVYMKSELPEKWHVKRSKVMTPIVTLATPGFWFRFTHKTILPMRQIASQVRGAHGYEHTAPEMRAIFMAIGPSFKNRSRIQLLEAVDVYPMLCSIFGARPSPNNGSLTQTKPLLSRCPQKTSTSILNLQF